MRSDHYLHPEFGVLSPTPRFRRELRTACFSVLFGIGIGAAAVIALTGNKDADDVGVSHRLSSASVTGEKKVHEVDASKPDRSTAEANSENEKKTTAKTCGGTNSSCGNIPLRSTEPPAMRMRAANDGLTIGRVPLGRSDAPGMTSAASSASSEPAHLSAGRSDEAVGDGVRSERPVENKRKITSRQDRSQQGALKHGGASPIRRSHDKPVREVDRAYALDRSLGPKGFWDWSH